LHGKVDDRCIRSQYELYDGMTAEEQRKVKPPTNVSDSGFEPAFQRWLERLANDHVLQGCAPVDTVEGAGAAGQAVVEPLQHALSFASERIDIRIHGEMPDGQWIASTGHVIGIFRNELFGVPPTGRVAHLRFGRFERMQGERVAETLLIFDIPGLMMQAGVWPLASPLGPVMMVPGPSTRDGVDPPGSLADGQDSMQLVGAMIAGLMRYDRQSLASMRMVDFWTDSFLWFGPAAIGSFCGHKDYERGHQGPFLAAFPDRVGGNHRCRIAQGAYVASSGWPSIRATHSGGDWLGLAPTGKPVTMRVMDFWRREGERLAENWVFVDVIDLLHQLGVDVFARMRALQGSKGPHTAPESEF
jgi:predicted ester cyclase